MAESRPLEVRRVRAILGPEGLLSQSSISVQAARPSESRLELSAP